MKTIFWTGYSHEDRFVAIKAIETIVNDYGFITDFKQFSDISISIKIELEAQKIDDLYDSLSSYLTLKESEKINATSKQEYIVFLNVTFTKSSGNLRIEVPNVPG